METSKVLNRAADLIEERGWWNGRPETVGGTCPMLALDASSSDDHALFHGASEVLEDYLGVYSIPQWNDAPARTAAEVIEVLRACAVIQASRERETAPEPVSV